MLSRESQSSAMKGTTSRMPGERVKEAKNPKRPANHQR